MAIFDHGVAHLPLWLMAFAPAIGLTRRDQSEPRPELQLIVLGREPIGLDVLMGRGGKVAVRDKTVTPVGELVRIVNADQPAQLTKRVGMIFHPKVDDPIRIRPLGRDDEDGG